MKGDVARGSCCERLAGEAEEADGWGESWVDERVLFALCAARKSVVSGWIKVNKCEDLVGVTVKGS